MSAFWPGNMRGVRAKTPLLLLLLLLLTSLTRTVFCQYDDDPDQTNPDSETGEEETGDSGGSDDTEMSELPPTDPDATSAPDPSPTDILETEEHGSGMDRSIDREYTGATEDPNFTGPTSVPLEEEGLSPIIILIPVVLVVVIIGMIVCGIFINRKWNTKARNQELRKEDPYLDGPSENVPMPMFEEDVPSVLELEMEELDQWMKKDGETAGDTKLA